MEPKPYRIDEIPDKPNARKDYNTIPALLLSYAIAVLYYVQAFKITGTTQIVHTHTLRTLYNHVCNAVREFLS